MPELPEVETIVQELRANLIGAQITAVNVFWPRTIAIPEVKIFTQMLLKQTIQNIERRGKFIVFKLNDYTLLVHLRMTGKFLLSLETLETAHERVQIQFHDGRILHFEDQRKFGKWYLLADPTPQFNKLGIEPLSKEFTVAMLEKMCKSSSQQIKPFLLNQRYIVGLGNIYVDEALWEAKIHPLQKISSLNKKQIKELHYAIMRVLQQGINHMGTSLGTQKANYFSLNGRRGGNQAQLKVFRRTGLFCSRCQNTIVKIIVGQRSTHLCPHCQIFH
jgi:formamidopyrimidine-DNA glycosylase